MKQTRRKFDAKFKAKVAIESIKGRRTLNELAAKYEVSPTPISRGGKRSSLTTWQQRSRRPGLTKMPSRRRKTGLCARSEILRCSWILRSGYPGHLPQEASRRVGAGILHQEVSSQRAQYRPSQLGLEYRHYIHPDEEGIYVSDRNHRRLQSFHSRLEPAQHA